MNTTDMKPFRIVPLPAAYAARVKKSGVDDYGHAVLEQVATGKGPCRVSLRPFVVGQDRRLLFSHSPFEIDNAFNQTGPVFIRYADVPEYDDVHRFPPEIKADRQAFPLSLIGYSNDQQMIFTKLVGDADVDDLIVEILAAQPGVDFLHARNAEAGCFICKIERC